VYRFYNAKGDLLYVGITNRLPVRLGEHEGDKAWWSEVERITVTHLSNRKDAELLEKAAIKEEKPKYNIAHNGTVAITTKVTLSRWTGPDSNEELVAEARKTILDQLTIEDWVSVRTLKGPSLTNEERMLAGSVLARLYGEGVIERRLVEHKAEYRLRADRGSWE